MTSVIPIQHGEQRTTKLGEERPLPVHGVQELFRSGSNLPGTPGDVHHPKELGPRRAVKPDHALDLPSPDSEVRSPDVPLFRMHLERVVLQRFNRGAKRLSVAHGFEGALEPLPAPKGDDLAPKSIVLNDALIVTKWGGREWASVVERLIISKATDALEQAAMGLLRDVGVLGSLR